MSCDVWGHFASYRQSRNASRLYVFVPFILHLQVNNGVVLHFYGPSGPSTSSLHVRLGETTAQDLNIDLGTPSRIYYKDDERMAIHSPNSQLDDESQSTDCKSCVLVEQSLVMVIRLL